MRAPRECLPSRGNWACGAATPDTRRRLRAGRAEKARAGASLRSSPGRYDAAGSGSSSTRRVLVDSEVRGTAAAGGSCLGCLERARAQRLCCLALHTRFEALQWCPCLKWLCHLQFTSICEEELWKRVVREVEKDRRQGP